MRLEAGELDGGCLLEQRFLFQTRVLARQEVKRALRGVFLSDVAADGAGFEESESVILLCRAGRQLAVLHEDQEVRTMYGTCPKGCLAR